MSADVETGEIAEFAQQVADQIESFLLSVRAVAAAGDGGRAIPILLLEVSQVLLAGARLGAQNDFQPSQEYQPDVGPEADMDDMRMRLADMFGSVDTYGFVFDAYDPEVVVSQISDDLTAVALDLENGLRHFRHGDIAEALWWWQFSYVSNWGTLAGAVLSALLNIVAHDRLDSEFSGEDEEIEVAKEILAEG